MDNMLGYDYWNQRGGKRGEKDLFEKEHLSRDWKEGRESTLWVSRKGSFKVQEAESVRVRQ